MIILYVDNIGIGACTEEIANSVLSALQQRCKVSRVGDWTDTQCLGVRVRYDQQQQTVALTQSQYIMEALETFGLSDLPPAVTPLPSDLNDQPIQEGEDVTDAPYLKGIGTLSVLDLVTLLQQCVED